MQEDMHFYGTYAIARSAGIEPNDAFKIAYSAQFVDDSAEQDSELHEDMGLLYGIATAHHKKDCVINSKLYALEEQRRVWIPFHFMPGGVGETFEQKLVCLQNSKIAQEFFKNHVDIALSKKSFGLHLLGIAAHVYADTFSHYGFSGLSSECNAVDGKSIETIGVQNPEVEKYVQNKAADFAMKYLGVQKETISDLISESTGNLGHGSVATYPDRPFLHWKVTFTNKHPNTDDFEDRDNPATYLEACKHLHNYFSKFAGKFYDNPAIINFSDISDIVEKILRFEGKKIDRIAEWKNAIASGELFEPSSLCKEVHYDPEDWESEKINFHTLPKSSDAIGMDIYKFHQASTYHRYYVLKDLLPAHGIIAY